MDLQQIEKARQLLGELIDRSPEMDPTKLAREIGRGPGFIRDFLKGRKNSFSSIDLNRIEDVLKIPHGSIFSGKSADLLVVTHSDEDHAPSVATMIEAKRIVHAQEPSSPNADIGHEVRYSRKMTPIYGRAAGGSDGRFLFNGEPQGYVPSPPTLADVKDAYAVYVHGTSMEPKYESGQLVFAAPHLPVRAGSYVVVQLKSKNQQEPPSGYVKKFISRSSKQLVLEQFNPPEGEDKRMVFPDDEVLYVHKIVTSNEI